MSAVNRAFLSALLGDHPIYLNQGEVPIGGRGAAGRTPCIVQLDMKGEYDSSAPRGSKVLKLGLDAFNVTNSQPIVGKVQYLQQSGCRLPGCWFIRQL